MEACSPPTIVRLTLLVALMRTTNGLEFSLSHSTSDLPGRRSPCGVLLCTENRPDTTGNVSLPQIVNITVFKTIAPTLGSSGSSEPTRLTQLATVSSTQPNLDQVANGMTLSGRFTEGQVNLKIELFKETDCLGEFTCVLTEVNVQGEKVIHSHRLLPQRPKQENAQIQETSISSRMLMKQLTAMEELNVKLSLIANNVERLESKVNDFDDKEISIKLSLIANNVERLESNVHMIDDKVCQLDSKLSAVDSEAIQEKVLGTIKAQIDDHFSKLFDALKGTDDIPKTTGLLLTSLISQNKDFQNNVMESCRGLFDNVTRGLDETFIRNMNAIIGQALTEISSTLGVFEFKNFIHHLIALSVDSKEKLQEMENFTDTEIARLDHVFERLEKSIETKQSVNEARLDTIESVFSSLKMNLSSKQDILEAKVEKNKNMISDQISDVGRHFTDTNNNVSALRNDQSSLGKLLAQLEVFLKIGKQWPGGNYALLRPKSGCPLDLAFLGGTHSYLKLHTQSQSSSDPADDHSAAFGQNTKSRSDSNNFVTLEFCEVPGQWNFTSWPSGTFCVHKLLHHFCPGGFLDGDVGFDTEDTSPATVIKNNVTSDDINKPKIQFCCQDSAPATVPIQLPTHSPFMLYRRGGVCQAVQGMSVSEEFVQVNTEDSSNIDDFSGSHPDVDKPGSSVIKLNLCYYTKL